MKLGYLAMVIFLGAMPWALRAQIDRADSLKRKGSYSEALVIYKQLLEEDLSNGNTKELGVDYNNIAGVYTYMGEYQKSTDYFFKSLRLAEKEGNKKSIAVVNYNISLNYSNMGQIELALPYVNEAIKILLADKENELILADCYNLLAAIYESTENYKKALDNYTLAEQIFVQNDKRNLLANVYVNLSHLELNRGNYNAVDAYVRKALPLFRASNDKIGEAAAYINLQVSHYNASADPKSPAYKRELVKCIALLDSALAAIKGIASPEHFITIYQNKTELYEYLGNADSAYAYIQKYVDLKDSIYNVATQKQIQELRIEYEVDKKEKENEILASESKNKTYFIMIVVTAAALIVSILLLLIVKSNSKKKQKEVEFERNKLEIEQRALRAQMNPHFVFNAINSIQRYVLKKDQQTAYDYLAKFSKLIRLVLNNSLEKISTLGQELEMIELYVEIEQLRFDRSFEFEVEIGKDVDWNETPMPAMLIQPYVENAIWHGLMNMETEKKGVLRLMVAKEKQGIKITIEDNGIGREKAKEYRREENHRSVGMKLTEQRLLMINKMQERGEAKVVVTDLKGTDGKAQGTRVEIILPMHES